jgi:hypothetical protein
MQVSPACGGTRERALIGTKWDLSGTKWDLSGTKWDLSGTKWDLSGTMWDLSGTKWDLSGTMWDLSGTKWDLIGTKWDLSGTMWDLSGTTWDLSGTKWDLSGTMWDLSGTKWGLSGTPWLWPPVGPLACPLPLPRKLQCSIATKIRMGTPVLHSGCPVSVWQCVTTIVLGVQIMAGHMPLQPLRAWPDPQMVPASGVRCNVDRGYVLVQGDCACLDGTASRDGGGLVVLVRGGRS